ncbi:hypothetical protein VRRI112168_02265 [Vreelandella rituensis]|uniref:Uncharacterized protein n=1 Tax=Vreelandella rituensis TaxID=2282306 RepID=A0A368U9H1_9GAMM|nr:hypothetical protein [Halomonas rituensis]RCV93574.1 hypothetical protein DU506_00010 [Halomonas rituensis]
MDHSPTLSTLTAAIIPFLSISQIRRMGKNLRDNDVRSATLRQIQELANTVSSMPVTYEQDGLGDQAIAYLHYFMGGADFFITEKDMKGDGTLGGCPRMVRYRL